jgi:hypothetical protein
MEAEDEAHPSTQIYGMNRRKTPQIMRSKIGQKILSKVLTKKNIVARGRR